VRSLGAGTAREDELVVVVAVLGGRHDTLLVRVYRPAALVGSAVAARAANVLGMLGPPVCQGDQGLGQRPAEWCQRVLDSRRDVPIDLTADQSVALERAQRLGHPLLRDPGEAVEQAAVPVDAARQDEQEVHLPFPVKDLECLAGALDEVEVAADVSREL
jgi:hypothetical protein